MITVIIITDYRSLRSGHDPASPLMEMQINFHETGWAIMVFVATTVILSMRKF